MKFIFQQNRKLKEYETMSFVKVAAMTVDIQDG